MTPADLYADRLVQRTATLTRLEGTNARIADFRLGVFGAMALIAFGVWAWDWTLWWLLAPAAVFLVLVVLHDGIIKKETKARRAIKFYEDGIARLESRWQGRGDTRTLWVKGEHPFAGDLDLFGAGSLFELLCLARTESGKDRLAHWLLHPAQPGEIGHRQEGAKELRDGVEFREMLSLAGGALDASSHSQILAKWGAAPDLLSAAKMRLCQTLAWTGALATIGTLYGWSQLNWGPIPFAAVALVEWGVYRWLRDPLGAVLQAAEQPVEELALLSELLALWEPLSPESNVTRRLLKALRSGEELGSSSIGRLSRIIGWLDARRNQFFAPVAWLLMWNIHFGVALEKWRQGPGRSLARWLDTLAELEALQSIANYHYENPADPFPKLRTESEAFFLATDLGHPLLPGSECVANDVHLGANPRMLLVSGSNMSGKSTLLRTVGVNAVLAQAGAPVRAESLEMSQLFIGATLRVNDSLHSGTSRFFAELKRLKQVVDIAAQSPPLLFLLDEIFHGTNSHDRASGVAGLLAGLLAKNSIGLVTTHDLALTAVVEELQQPVKNVHFSDEIIDGKPVFDYRMRDGIVQHSNALELMRLIGLQIEERSPIPQA